MNKGNLQKFQPHLIPRIFVRFFFASKILENIAAKNKMKAWNVINHIHHYNYISCLDLVL